MTGASTIPAVTERDLAEHLVEPANANEAHVRRGRHLDAVLLLGIGEHHFYVTIREGRITAFEPGPKPLQAVAFAIKAPAETWQAFWEPVPKPGFLDILGLVKARRATIEGDVRVLMTHLRFIKDLLATPRGRMAPGSGKAAHG